MMCKQTKGGCILGDVDALLAEHGVATTVGHQSNTGVGGLFLQGGHGFLERKFGITYIYYMALNIG